MIRVVQLLNEIGAEPMLAAMCSTVMGSGLMQESVLAALSTLVEEVGEYDEGMQSKLKRALHWGIKDTTLGDIVENAQWRDGLGSEVCALRVSDSVGDWCLGLVISADAMLGNLDDGVAEEEARKTLILATGMQCAQLLEQSRMDWQLRGPGQLLA